MSTRQASEQNAGHIQRITGEPLVNGIKEMRRYYARELLRHRVQQSGRAYKPHNIWIVGDSVSEGYGVASDYETFAWIFRDGIQRTFKYGGAGYIPSTKAQGVTWPFTTNPDGKNTWSLDTGSLTDNTDYGFGFGRKSVWLANGARYKITIDTDRFFLHYTAGPSTGTVITVEIDRGTPWATSATFNSVHANTNVSGRVWDSGLITEGTHTVHVTATTGTFFLDGITVFKSDAENGIRVFTGAHSAYTSEHFGKPLSSGAESTWADLAWQPAAPTAVIADGVGNGTTTFTSASAAFVDNDIGEWIVFGANYGTVVQNGVARIVSRNSGTSVVLDRVYNASQSSIPFQINRSQVTDAVTYGTLSQKLTSATAAFKPWDEGKYVSGPTSIPSGTYIKKYISATEVTMSNYATASQSAQTLRIKNRELNHLAPDTLIVQLGINDVTQAKTISQYKTNIKNLVTLTSERAARGQESTDGVTTSPSVILLGLWAPSWLVQYQCVDGNTTNGSAILTSERADFGPEDVGKTITSTGNTPIPAGTTILSVQSNRQITLSQNAVATTTTGQFTIALRAWQDRHWQPWRTAMMELSEEMGWTFLDLYSDAGWIGTNDPLMLTTDGCHVSTLGSSFVSDRLLDHMNGQVKQASIPNGLANAKGSIPVSSGPDVFEEFKIGPIPGQMPSVAPGASDRGQSLGMVWIDPGVKNRFGAIYANPGATTNTNDGILAAPVIAIGTGATVNADSAEAPSRRHTTGIVSGNVATVRMDGQGPAAGTAWLRSTWLPEICFKVRTDLTSIASVSYFFGLFSGDPSASDNPALSLAAFRYSTAADTAGFWTTCTKDGTTLKANLGVAAIAAATWYELRIETVGTVGSAPTMYRFWVNDVHVSDHTANLPATGSNNLIPWMTVRTLTTAGKAFEWSRAVITCG